ncbi:MAG: entericidin A/B family lipoprotein [Alphaproteobacteria bacterium]
MRKFFIALLVAAPLIVACNTVAGAGKDVKATGTAIEKAADKAKSN